MKIKRNSRKHEMGLQFSIPESWNWEKSTKCKILKNWPEHQNSRYLNVPMVVTQIIKNQLRVCQINNTMKWPLNLWHDWSVHKFYRWQILRGIFDDVCHLWYITLQTLLILTKITLMKYYDNREYDIKKSIPF